MFGEATRGSGPKVIIIIQLIIISVVEYLSIKQCIIVINRTYY